jgi:hypothetical protein
VKSIIYKILFIVGLLLGFSLGVKGQEEMPLVIIASNKGVPSELSLPLLKSVLKGEKLRWKDGTKVTVALMKTSTPLGMATCKRLYGMSPNELNKLFLALVFQGKGEAPTFFNTVAELQTFISQTAGAIGVIEPTPANKEKVILINGKESI